MTALPFFLPGPPVSGPPATATLVAEVGAIVPQPAVGLPGFALVFDGLLPVGSRPTLPPGTLPVPESPQIELPDETAPLVPESVAEEPTSLLAADLPSLPPSADLPFFSPPPPMLLTDGPDPAPDIGPPVRTAPITQTPPPPAIPAQPSTAPAAPIAEGRLPAKLVAPPDEPAPPQDAPAEPSRDKPAQVASSPLLPVAVAEAQTTEPTSAPDRLTAEIGGPDAPSEPRRAADPAHHPHRPVPEGQTPPERQIVTAVTTSATGRTEILLDPQDLGRVRVSLDGTDAALVVTIEAEKPETIDLLRRNADILIEEFRDAGYTSLSFNFAGRGDNAPQDFAPPTPAEADAAPTAAAEPPPSPVLRGTGAGLTSLDLRL